MTFEIKKFKPGRVPNVPYFKDALPSKNNKSGVKGVYWHKRDKIWVAVLYIYGKKVVIGYFGTVAEAERAIKKAREEY